MEFEPDPDMWNQIVAKVLVCNRLNIAKTLPDGTFMPHPSESGLFRRSVGERKGQIADWRASISGSNKGVHVVEYNEFYSIHVDRFDPYKKPVEHILHDSPRTGLSLALAGLAIFLLTRKLSALKRRR